MRLTLVVAEETARHAGRLGHAASAGIMTVGFLTNTLSGGGAEKQLLLTAAGLAERGHTCRIYCLTPIASHGRYTGLFDRCRAAGVSLIAPRTTLGGAWIVARLLIAMLAPRRCILWTWGFRAEFLRTFLPPLWWPRGVIALRTASEDHVRAHAWMLRCSRFVTWRYLANSQRGIDVFARLIPDVGTKGRVIYNALEADLLQQPPAPLLRAGNSMRVHMLGNVLWTVKGYDIALSLAQRVKQENRPVQIHIAGGALPGEKQLQDEIAAAGLDGVVTWAGKTADPVAFLRHADAFLLLSRYEGTPNALLEAMALGVPAIATDVGDLRRFAGEGAGLTIIPTSNTAAAYQAVMALVADAPRAAALGRQGRAFCQLRFNERRMLDDVETALGERRASENPVTPCAA